MTTRQQQGDDMRRRFMRAPRLSPDEAWATYAREGDRAALRTVFLHYGDALYRLARTITESDAVAHDIVERVFRALAGARPEVREAVKDPRVWLIRCVFGSCIEFRKSRDGSRICVGPPRDRLDLDFRLFNLDRVDTSRARQVGLAMFELPLPSRVAVFLQCVEGMGMDEIRAVTHMSRACFRTTVGKGLRSLRQGLIANGQPWDVDVLNRSLALLGREKAPRRLVLRLNRVAGPGRKTTRGRQGLGTSSR